jgi:hypothetical protein
VKGWIAAAVLALGTGYPAAAQDITYEASGVTLREALAQFAVRTGYDFSAGDLGPEIEGRRRDLALKGVPLARALKSVGELWNCEFFSLDTGSFRAIPLKAPDRPPTPAPPFRVSASPPYGNTQSRSMTLALMFAGEDEETVERIARLGPDLRVLDNFGRSVLPPDEAPTRGTTAPRVKLLEYRHRLQLTVPDDRAVRLRSISGSLVLYRKLTPVRLEFTLPDPSSGDAQSLNRSGLAFDLQNPRWDGKNFTAVVQMQWPTTLEVSGRGVSRHVLPYLIDQRGRAYRELSPRTTRRAVEGHSAQTHELRFDGVQAPPAALVYDVWVKEDATEQVPFRLAGVPMPDRAPAERPEQRPFYQADAGGVLTLRVTDRDGRPLEGEVTLGLARRTGAAFGPIRWLEVVTEADGSLRVSNVQPGVYRVTRLFRPAPGAKAAGDGRPPVEVTVVRGRETALPVLRTSHRAAQ